MSQSVSIAVDDGRREAIPDGLGRGVTGSGIE
jgi:hypothetical protein